MVELSKLCRRVGGGVDAPLLAAMVHARRGERVLELGAGCAQAAALIANRSPDLSVDALERQPELVAEGRQRLKQLGLDGRVRLMEGDLRQRDPQLAWGAYDHVLFNPPFFHPATHRRPPDPIRAAARMALHGDLSDFCQAAADALLPTGQGVLIHRPEMWREIQKALQLVGLSASGWVPVVASPQHAEPSLLLVCFTKQDDVEKQSYEPLVLRDRGGEESLQLQRILRGEVYDPTLNGQ
uniref:Methyltransferase small domain-containing protein n=1 Tax=Magnetococcus massalia (strain MO-1) TaxID=451514 RepID=A0A1S7LMF0_MAGMO|nr:Conserved protein of unknown function, putative RNA methyltransferase [Candidatus Magnetococcus massalia]